ncbi:MAG: beta-hydroxyacyl-ACP dehydratase [Phycisphaerales bacterium]|nr:beta-hydroxyacyl-ACP dehydratase [Phycisphaerae bacterium]NNF42796.1 beta-hydroxyacyl-ACP dehydratase [Phycisphaerales bacterium]NNM27010.1 beta-hydroxyacyl-ACP dehydratase [Phycisphaerales bacterium]
MASRQLFDLSGIDLQAVAIDADEVARINPQCGDMRQLDHVIWRSDDATQMLGVKAVSTDEFWVPLHIPGRPLMPGVLMIEAAAQLCSVQYSIRSSTDRFVGFTRCEATFRGQVVPGDTLHLLSEEIVYSPRRMKSSAQGVVNGKMIFEANITGMVL